MNCVTQLHPKMLNVFYAVLRRCDADGFTSELCAQQKEYNSNHKIPVSNASKA